MQSEQPLPKEIKYAQYLAYASAVLGFIGLAISPFVFPVHPAFINTYIGYLAAAGGYLFLLFLGWQLRQLRLWVYITLIVLTILVMLGAVAEGLDMVLLTPQDPFQRSIFYQIYSRGNLIIAAVVNVILLYDLTRPVVYEVFQSARHSGVSGPARSMPSRKVITILVILASCLFIPGMVLVILAFVFAVWHTPPGPMNSSMTSRLTDLLLTGFLLIAIGGIVDLVARIGALIEMAKAQKWLWFVLTILFGWLVLIAYLLAVKSEPNAVPRHPVHPPYSYSGPDRPLQDTSPSQT